MKTKPLYLGNGCLYAQVSENTISFINSSISTSQVVGIQEYEMFVNHDNLNVVKTDDVTLPHNGGGNETTSTLSIELKANTSFIIKCNALNQIDSYIKFEINANGNVSFKEVAAQCYYTNDFQGIIINDRFECVEKQFNTYLEFIKIKSVDALCALNIQYADYFDVIKFRKVGFNDADEMKHHYRAKAVEINDFKKQFEEVSSKFYNVVDNEEDKSLATSLLDGMRNLQTLMPEMACMEAAELTLHQEVQRAENYYDIFQAEHKDNRSEFVRTIEDNLQEMDKMYQEGKDVRSILYHFGISERNAIIDEELTRLFTFINEGDDYAAQLLYNYLVKQLGEDDPAMLEAATSLKYF